MKTFITDNALIKKKYPDFTLATTYLNEWKIEKEELKKSKISKISGELVGIVNKSNYRLIFDILNIDPKAKFIEPENFEFGKEDTYIPKDYKRYFMNFMKRSYLSYVSYIALKNLGLRRIEQFLVLLSFFPVNTLVGYDNLLFKDSFIVDKVSDKKNKTLKTDKINVLQFFHYLNKEYSYSYHDAFLMLHSLKQDLKISDFYEGSFKYLQDDDSTMCNICKELLKEVSYTEYTITTKEGKTFLIKECSELVNYHIFQKESYFEGKFIVGKEKETSNLFYLYPSLQHIISFKDFLLTFNYLVELKKINIDKMFFSIDSDVLKKLNVKRNLSWISKETWNHIYENADFHFRGIVEPLTIEESEWSCPNCESKKMKVTPTRISCACGFVFSRIALKDCGVPRLSIENIQDIFYAKSGLIKKEDGTFLKVALEKKTDIVYIFRTL